MTGITSLHNGVLHINAEEAFFRYEESNDISKLQILDIIRRVERFVKEDAAKRFNLSPTRGSLNNSRGRWFEMIMAHVVLRSDLKKHYVLKLPSATNDACYVDFFVPKRVKEKIIDINLHTSNPDFIILRGVQAQKRKEFRLFWEDIQRIPKRVSLQDIRVVFSVKTSPRPDRRYQMIHEANTIKTLHLVLKHTPPKYVVLMLESSGTDDLIFKYPVLFLLALGKNVPSIDAKVVAESYSDLASFLKKLAL